MTMKRIISWFLILVCFSSVLLTTGCQNSFSQEEFRVEYIEKLDKMRVKKNTTEELPDSVLLHCGVIADELTIFSGTLELYLHCYEIWKPDCEKITYDEIVSLYNSYDEDVYRRLDTFYCWLCFQNGFALVDYYRESMIKANEIYKEKFGESFFPDDRDSYWTLEQRISFEEFIRNNPDFMPAEEYRKELSGLGIK